MAPHDNDSPSYQNGGVGLPRNNSNGSFALSHSNSQASFGFHDNKEMGRSKRSCGKRSDRDELMSSISRRGIRPATVVKVIGVVFIVTIWTLAMPSKYGVINKEAAVRRRGSPYCTCGKNNQKIDGTYHDLHDIDTKSIVQMDDGSVVVTAFGGKQTVEGKKAWTIRTEPLDKNCRGIFDFNVEEKLSQPGILLYGQFSCQGNEQYATSALKFYAAEEDGDNATSTTDILNEWVQMSSTPLYP